MHIILVAFYLDHCKETKGWLMNAVAVYTLQTSACSLIST